MRGRVAALITGASSGIGAAVALRMARRGAYELILSGRDATRLGQVADACLQYGALRVSQVIGDVTTEKCQGDLFQAADAGAPLGVVINCAGVGSFGSTISFEIDSWQRLLATNLTATFRICRMAISYLAATRGTIINVSSDADVIGFSEAAAYCATKGGVLLMSRALQQELRMHGIRVCVVSPGRVDTRFNGKQPGMKPGALSADEVGEVIEFAATCSSNIELQEIRLDSMSRR